MKYHTYLDMDCLSLVQEKTKAYIENIHGVQVGFSAIHWDQYVRLCPEIITAFKRYKIYPLRGALYTTFTQEDSVIHIDVTSSMIHKCRINIPIINCEGSLTEFYSGGNYTEYSQKENGLSYFKINDNSAIKVDEVEIIKPTVIRIQEPHRVNTNLNKIPRICMTLWMNIDPVFLLED